MKAIARSQENTPPPWSITMLVIFLITVGIGIATNITTFTVRQTDNSRDFSALRSAAEGALDFGYGVLTKAIDNNSAPVANTGA